MKQTIDIGQNVIVATRILGEKYGRVVAISPKHPLIGVEVLEYPGSLLWVEVSQVMFANVALEEHLEDVVERLKRRIVELGGGAGDRISV